MQASPYSGVLYDVNAGREANYHWNTGPTWESTYWPRDLRAIRDALTPGAVDRRDSHVASTGEAESSLDRAVGGAGTIPYRLFAFSGAGGWNSGDNPTFRDEATALGAELYLAGPLSFPLGDAISSAKQFVKDNPNGRVNIMGYSAGGAEAIAFYHSLSKSGIGVDAIVLFDPHPPGSLGLKTFQITGSGVEVRNFFQQNPADAPLNTFRGGRVRGSSCSGCFIINVNMGLNGQSAFHSNIVFYPYEVHRELIESLLRR